MNIISEKKNKLRREILNKRSSVPDEQRKLAEKQIFNNLLSYSKFSDSKTVLVYYSVNNEIDTVQIIEFCLNNKKRVALPVCKDNRVIDFYYIESFSDLIAGKFNIPAPDVNKCKQVTDYSNAVCIVPALCFDKTGARLGYGGGYYDRFLNGKTAETIGLCFDCFLLDSIPSEEHDIRIKTVITESGIYHLKKDK